MDEKGVFRLAVVKFGCIGMAPLLEYILDERAERRDIEVSVFSSGSRITPEACSTVTECVINTQPDFVIMVSPNVSLPGPTASREQFAEAGVPLLMVTDMPSLKALTSKTKEGERTPNVLPGQGFIVVPMDPMIGARREFLDPTEMVMFNSDILRVLAATGVIRLVQLEIDRVIDTLKRGERPHMPTLTVFRDDALAAAGLKNPYAWAKGYAALTMAESVATITNEACFREKDKSRYVRLAMAAHELIRVAARTADEAREIEKAQNTVLRTPHSSAGETRQEPPI